MTNTSILVIETKCGSSTPRRVWEATNEADYIARVCADAGCCRISGVVTAADAAGYDAERLGQTVQLMTQEQFNQYDPESFCAKVLAVAERLGWYEESVAAL